MGFEISPGKIAPLLSCNVFIGDPAAITPQPIMLDCNFRIYAPVALQQEFFGETYNDLVGRSIIVSTWHQNTLLGKFSVILFIVHELACIKLVEQAAKTGLAKEDISKAEEMFFSYAYSYNFTYYLLKHLAGIQAKPTPDTQNVIFNFRESYERAMAHFDTMSKPEQQRFLILCDRNHGMKFGNPFSVDITNTGISSIQRL